MTSRMSKYYEADDDFKISRYKKNEDLYKEIGKSELQNYDIKSNATIIGDNKNEIDVEKIKKILDTKYNELPKRRSIRLDEIEEKEPEKETTKEYDINVILEKAKETKETNYEEERLKQLRDTQYDILNNLNIEKTNVEEVEEPDNLKKLIDTIALNEINNQQDSNPLDILSDLKGDDNTEVLDGLKEEVENTENKDLSNTSNFDTKMINSFYTSSNQLNKKDFEDMDDFAKDMKSDGIFVKVLIVLVVIALLVGIALLVKSIFF